MDRLDLVLLTDEPIAWEGDYWFRSDQKLTQQMRALSITEAEKLAVEREFGIKDYFRPLPPASSGGKDSGEQLYRIRVPHRPHLSLCDLATVSQDAGYTVRVIDNIMRYPSRMEQVKLLLRDQPRAVGLSTTFLLTASLVRQYVDTIRELAPDSKIILGGPSIRKFKELHNYADYVVCGDGEDALLAILEVLHGKRSPETIPNSAYTLEDKSVRYGPGGTDACHCDQVGKPYKATKVKIPIANWRLVNRSFKNVFPIEFSRGCQKNCFYCSYDRGKTIRDLAGIKQELLTNAELGISRYRISDSNFTDGPPSYEHYPHDICKLMIDLKLNLQWSCYARVDDMTDELASLMGRAGCFGVFFGIESGDDGILRQMNKHHSVAEAYEGVKIAKKHGLFCHASFIVGYPGETRETFLKTLDFIEKANLDTVNLGQYRVEHDTIAYSKKKFKVQGQGMTWTHYTMDSKMADSLVVEGNERLLRNGICLGTECGFPVFMGLGLSHEESFQTMKDLDTVGLDYTRDESAFQSAASRLRTLILERFPMYIKEDQHVWDRAC